MTWKRLLKELSGVAPTFAAAAAAGGPVAGALAAIARLVAQKDGEQDVSLDELATRILGSPELRVKMEELALEREKAYLELHKRKLEIKKARQEIVNQTMIAEARAEDPWTRRWRPFWGFVSGGTFAVVASLFAWAAARAVILGDQAALSTMPSIVTAFTSLFSIPGVILGVSAWHRGVEKRIKAGEKKGGTDNE